MSKQGDSSSSDEGVKSTTPTVDSVPPLAGLHAKPGFLDPGEDIPPPGDTRHPSKNARLTRKR
jgi:hypothetical protein